MNIFTPEVANDDERRRIASRPPLKVYVPTSENTEYVSDFTGNYWQYRTLTVREVLNNKKLGERTANRSSIFGIVDTRPPGHNFPDDLYRVADTLNADFICPVQYTGHARDAIHNPVEAYQNYDFTNNPRFITPVPHPYSLTINSLRNGLYEQHTPQSSVQSTSHPTDFLIRDLAKYSLEWTEIKEILEHLQESTSGDVNIHLHAPPLSGDMIRYIRSNNGVIDSIILPTDKPNLLPTMATDETDDDIYSMFSRRGNYSLRGRLCPYVRVASEISLLASDYLAIDTDKQFSTVIEESVLPKGSTSVEPIQDAEEAQQTLTSMMS